MFGPVRNSRCIIYAGSHPTLSSRQILAFLPLTVHEYLKASSGIVTRRATVMFSGTAILQTRKCQISITLIQIL